MAKAGIAQVTDQLTSCRKRMAFQKRLPAIGRGLEWLHSRGFRGDKDLAELTTGVTLWSVRVVKQKLQNSLLWFEEDGRTEVTE
jgi:hypothetical protein